MSWARFEAVRSIAAGSLTGAYQAVGSATSNPVRLVFVSNATQGDIMVSIDGTNDAYPVLAGTSVLLDIQANIKEKDDNYVLPAGTTFYVKQLEAPVDKSVYISCMY